MATFKAEIRFREDSPMPELPDVEVFKQVLDSTSLGQQIRGAGVDAGRMLQGVSRRTLRSRLKRHRLESTRRHGKNLFVRLSGNGWLWLHFGMTGGLEAFEEGARAPAHTRLRFDFSSGRRLAYFNTRKLGKIGLVDDVDSFVARERLGPDALSLGFGAFRDALNGRRGTIKSTLMNQKVIAGIGNVYADEILFAASVDPRACTDELAEDTLRGLHRSMCQVLRRAIAARALPDRMPRNFLLPHRADDRKCPRCGSSLRRTKVSGRTTVYCPRDQKRRH